jgi:hypothetical protein
MSKYYEKLSKMKSAELLQIMHDCEELLCPVSPAKLARMQGKSKRAILNQIEAGKHMIFEFDGRKYPIINDHL